MSRFEGSQQDMTACTQHKTSLQDPRRRTLHFSRGDHSRGDLLPHFSEATAGQRTPIIQWDQESREACRPRPDNSMSHAVHPGTSRYLQRNLWRVRRFFFIHSHQLSQLSCGRLRALSPLLRGFAGEEASMLLRPVRPYSNNARLPLQPQEYCAPKSPTVFHAVMGLLLA